MIKTQGRRVVLIKTHKNYPYTRWFSFMHTYIDDLYRIRGEIG